MEFLKIVGMSVVAAVVYGLIHDQITIRISPQYFTVFHPHLISTTSLTLLAIAWGIVATWWAGLIMGLLLAMAARAGREPKVASRDLVFPIASIVVAMALGALTAGILTFRTERGARLLAVAAAHNASYAVGFLGSLVLCIWTLFRRWRRDRARNIATA